ncbi:MAG: CHASE3 domain-containing protein [Candidatus Sulfotelmatobacter sp.]
MFSTAKVNAVLAMAVVFLLLSSGSAYFAFQRLQTSEQWVLHSLDVQHALDQLPETAGRAGRLRSEYVQSGDPVLLSRQAEAAVEVRNTLSSIQRLTADNVSQQGLCERLVELTERRMALMDQAMELRRSGKSTAEAQVPLTREMMSAADDTETVIHSMRMEEQRLLSERRKREAASFSMIAGVLLTSLFLALVLFLIHHQLLTDQVRERLRAETAQRNLSARLLTLQDEERRKFARELHDSVGQHLAAIKMAIEMLHRKLPGDAIVVDCIKLSDDAISETRTISHLLHPPLLDEAGLNSAIRWFVEGFAKRSGIEVNLQISDPSRRFEDSVELVLFRALQESLTNVHRHSGATQADVSLAISGNRLALTVKDNGRGMPATALRDLKEDGTAGGVGLAGMMERIREIGGRLEIKSGSQGTEVVARVPVRQQKNAPSDTFSSEAQQVRG